MLSKFDSVLMDTAFLWSRQSSCERRKVGCVIAKDSRIISIGFNGTVSGLDNCCEDLICTDCDDMLFSECDCEKYYGSTKTKEIVLHAEQNALMFALKQGISTNNASLYCTDAPCATCSKLIIQAGITKVFYSREYNNTKGLELLSQARIVINKIEKE